MLYLFPESFINIGKVDSDYRDQWDQIQARSLCAALITETGTIKGGNRGETSALYRGWMMTGSDYTNFYNKVLEQGVRLINGPAEYVECHYISGWYSKISELTIPSVLYESKDAITKDSIPRWNKYFVKDFVKSLTTKRGSVASGIDEINDVIAQIEKYRGMIDGGICIRQYVDIDIQSEERHFVYMGKAHSRNGHVPSIVSDVASLIGSKFFSVDVAKDISGREVIVELGDGQVSDYKQWEVKHFIDVIT